MKTKQNRTEREQGLENFFSHWRVME